MIDRYYDHRPNKHIYTQFTKQSQLDGSFRGSCRLFTSQIRGLVRREGGSVGDRTVPRPGGFQREQKSNSSSHQSSTLRSTTACQLIDRHNHAIAAHVPEVIRIDKFPTLITKSCGHASGSSRNCPQRYDADAHLRAALHLWLL